MPGGFIKTFGLYSGHNQVGFLCFAEYVPWKDKSARRVLHANRLVVHPDYVGFGLGDSFINACAAILQNEFRIMTKFSALPVYKALIKNPQWKLVDSKFDTSAGYLDTETKARRKKVKWWSFEFIGE